MTVAPEERVLRSWAHERAAAVLVPVVGEDPSLPMTPEMFADLVRLGVFAGAEIEHREPAWSLHQSWTAAEAESLAGAFDDARTAARNGASVVVDELRADIAPHLPPQRRFNIVLPRAWTGWLRDPFNSARLQAFAWWLRRSGGFRVQAAAEAPPRPIPPRFAPSTTGARHAGG